MAGKFESARTPEEVRRAASGEAPVSAQEIEALVDAHQNGLIRYAYRYLRSRELAQDIVQDAFVRYLRKPLDYGEPRQRAAWLYRVTHNLCIDLVKRESKRGEIHDAVAQPTVARLPIKELMAAERWEGVERLLEVVSENQRMVLLLFFQEERSYKEIAEITGLSMSNVGMLLHRGLRKLRSVMEEKNITEF